VLLEALIRNTTPQGGGVERRDDFSDFLRIQQLTFTRAEDPQATDHWLRTIEQKLTHVRCKDHEKVLFATHQLQGPIGVWWSNYLALHPANYRMSWAEFRQAFCDFHIPKGLMEIKRREFMDLKEGGKSVMKYVQVFNHLAQYAHDEVNTDEQKQYLFINGLNSKMQDCCPHTSSSTSTSW
jgi:Retrotransposon gag protein